MALLAAIGWALIVVLKGATPITGIVVEGFATREACEVEREHYCASGLYICACRPTLKEDP